MHRLVFFRFPKYLLRAEPRLPYSCLDDAELTYLGVSWSDYARIADEIGIDVLRSDLPYSYPTTFPTVLIQNTTAGGAHSLGRRLVRHPYDAVDQRLHTKRHKRPVSLQRWRRPRGFGCLLLDAQNWPLRLA